MVRPGPDRRVRGSNRDARSSRPPERVRIIGGDWKRTPLEVVNVPGLRPTPDRVRETVFNWLGQRLDGCVCLDLYAGSGALGFEAASRGAARVVCVERDPLALQALRSARERLHARSIEIVAAQASHWLAQTTERFDLIFLDPPFASDEMVRVGPYLMDRLQPEAWVYVESGEPLPEHGSVLPDLVVHRAGRAGQVHFHLLRPRAAVQGD